MTRTKKLLTVLLASILALLTLFTGVLIPTKADEPEVRTKKVSVLDSGGVSFLIRYDAEETEKLDVINTIDFVPEGGITSYNQDVTIKSTWAGRWGVEAVQLYIIVDLTGTPYENYNNITIELTRLKPEGLNYAPVEIDGFAGIGGPVADSEFLYTEEDNTSAKNFKIQKVSGFEGKQACIENGGFTTTINKAEVEKRFTLYNDNNIFKSAMYNGEDVEHNAELNVTYDFACYVEIDEDKIKINKAENWFNETGDKISDFVSENLGVTIGGTTSLVVIVAVILIIFLRRRRR